MRARGLVIVVLAAVLGPASLARPAPADAADAERLDGRALMERLDESQRTDSGYAEGLVTVEDKGRVREKAWREWRLGWGGEARGLVQFLEPAEVRGVGLLTLGHSGKPDEQWFYAPAMDRHRRIARVEKSTRFLGTHFTYEDMEPRDVDDHEYRRLGDGELEGAPCYRIEARPRSETESQYSKEIFWVRRDPLVTIRVEGYVEGKLRRTFHASDVRTVEGIATAHRWAVDDEKRSGRTTLVLRNVRHHLELEEELFSREAMRVTHSPP
ncbi:MAG: outer membrane lipoprotein-sorting protein [bacterium]|nr:outer membrane lipoprotein-sorting protein [bacterium]